MWRSQEKCILWQVQKNLYICRVIIERIVKASIGFKSRIVHRSRITLIFISALHRPLKPMETSALLLYPE
jgi:hypothetical protein